MASYPADLRYSKQHVWVRARERLMTVGITEHAAELLGEVSFTELPYPGELFKPGAFVGRLSSPTASSSIYMPFVGQINAINAALSESPALVSSDPYGDGWIVRIESDDHAGLEGLMDAAQYEAFLSSGEA